MATIKTDDIEVSAASLGAELTSIKSSNGCEYLWQADPRFWPRRSPLLFPIVGALPGGEYGFGGNSYKLGNHGFAREREFALAKRSADELRFELESDERSLEVYPFKFKLDVGYGVRDNCLTVTYGVENRDGKTMYFSIGAHPAFRAPVLPEEKREDFDLVFEKKERVRRHFLTADNLRSGETESLLEDQDRLPLGSSLFERGAIVLVDHVSRRVTMRSRLSGRFVELRFPGFPQLGIWSPKGDVPFVCIEPWHGVMPLVGSTRDIAHKEGCIALEPGGSFGSSYEIRVG